VRVPSHQAKRKVYLPEGPPLVPFATCANVWSLRPRRAPWATAFQKAGSVGEASGCRLLRIIYIADLACKPGQVGFLFCRIIGQQLVVFASTITISVFGEESGATKCGKT
tara:strand:- start:465 stop:794 length:330 start_codon:yes stop_codon:yes gene_type:complete